MPFTAAAAGETHAYKDTGGCRVKATVYTAGGGGRRPVLLWIHGGALITGTRTTLEDTRPWQLERYLAAGFTVVAIDYRLAPETKLPAIWEDIRDAWRWVRERGPSLYRADPNRIVLAGHSAGGYLALLAGAALSPRPRAIASYYGYGNLLGDWYTQPDDFYRRQPLVPKEEALAVVGDGEVCELAAASPRSRFYLYTRQQGLWPALVVGLDPVRQAAGFAPWLPVRRVSRQYPPTILLHGGQDTDVPFAESAAMAREFARHGVRHELIRMEGLGHSFDRDEKDPRVVHAFARALAFLIRHSR